MSAIKTARVVFLCFVAVFLVSFTMPPPSGPSTIIWTDDFDDQLLDDWIITRGAFSAEQQTLWASGTENPTSNRACHENQVTAGKWSFDILLKKEWRWNYHPPKIHFMSSSLDGHEWEGYCLDFYTILASDGDYFSLHLRKRTDFWVFITRYDYHMQANGWQHVEITHSSVGRITISLNGTLLIDVVDTSVESSSYFVFDSEDCAVTMIDPDTRSEVFVEALESPMLDNIVVVEIEDEPKGYGSAILFVASSAAMLIILLTFVLKRLGFLGN
ncbi:MAG: hypothetical protein ACW98Y_01190 [Candidatus Thorarchaeota archaeon]